MKIRALAASRSYFAENTSGRRIYAQLHHASGLPVVLLSAGLETAGVIQHAARFAFPPSCSQDVTCRAAKLPRSGGWSTSFWRKGWAAASSKAAHISSLFAGSSIMGLCHAGRHSLEIGLILRVTATTQRSRVPETIIRETAKFAPGRAENSDVQGIVYARCVVG